MLLDWHNKHLMMLKNYQIQHIKLQQMRKIKDKNVLQIQLMLDMLYNRLKKIQELLNGIQKKLYLYYIRLKQEKKLLTDHLPQPLLKAQLILMDLIHYLDHQEDGKEILQIQVIILSKQLKILVNVENPHYQDLLDLLK